MIHTGAIRTAAAATLLGASALVGVTGLTAGMAAGATQVATKPPAGLFVSGEAKLTTAVRASAYVVDRKDREHFITLVPNPNHAGKDTVEYYSRALGSKGWTIHAAPTLVSAKGSPRIEADLDFSSGDIDVVVYSCTAIYAADVASSAVRLPEFTTVQSESSCAGAASASPDRLSAVFESEVGGVSLAVIARAPGSTGTWGFLTGKPGGTFANLLTLPTAHSFVPAQLAADPNYDGDLTVVGRGVDGGGHEGVYTTRLSWTYEPMHGDVPSWSAPKEVATLGETHTDYQIDSALEYNKTTEVALYKAPGSSPGQTHTLFIDEGDSSDQWSSPIPLVHTNLHDRDLLLATDYVTGTLHVAFMRTVTTSKTTRTTQSGVLQQRLHASWTTPLFLTRWYRDVPLQASVDSHGTIHVLYSQKI